VSVRTIIAITASLHWHTTLHGHLVNNGFTTSLADPCVYINTQSVDTPLLLAVYVDDIVLACASMSRIDDTKAMLHARFAMTDAGVLKFCLGIHIVHGPTTISINQKLYIDHLLDRFQITSSVSTPMDSNAHLVPNINTASEGERRLFRQIVGYLMHAMVGTRPDICHAVGTLSRFMHNPSATHLLAAKRVLHYLHGTTTVGVTFNSSKAPALTGYSDATWACDIIDRKSTSGYVFLINGSPISWSSRKQTSVSLSSTESEYIALGDAAREATWLRNLLETMSFKQDGPTTVYEDNQSAIIIANNPTKHDRTKHIDIRHHYLRYLVAMKLINVVYCPTKDMLADGFTKALPPAKFISHREKLNVRFVEGGC